MSTTILGITLGGEASRIKDAEASYASKYPLSGDINQLRENLGNAVIELGTIKGDTPDTPGGKRIQQRNITALTNWTIKLQSAINDASIGLGSGTDNFTLKLPISKLTLFKSPYDTSSTPDITIPSEKSESGNTGVAITPKKSKKSTQQNEVVDNTDGGQPQIVNYPKADANGNYPPPKTSKINYGMWAGIGAIGIGVIALGYFLISKNKK